MPRFRIRAARKVLAIVAALGLCVVALAAVLSWDRILLRYHLYHLGHGPGRFQDSAFQYLLRRSSLHAEDSMRVDEVIVLPQEDGGDVLAIFEPDDDEDSIQGERTAWLFDRKPTLICLGDIQPGGMKDLTGDGIDEILMEIYLTSSDDRDYEVYVVLSTDRIRRPLLIVCCESGDGWWSCQARQDASLGAHDIEIGMNLISAPRGKERERIVTFSWSPATGGYVGPKGGNGERYERLESLAEIPDFIERPPLGQEPSQPKRD
jgi:hypothetical protein